MLKSGVFNVFIFLLLMDSCGVIRSQSPGIPYLTVLEGASTHRILSNQSIKYSAKSFSNLEVVCEAESSEEPVNYFWNLVDIPLAKADKEFEIENGTLRFMEPNFGMFECFASNSFGTSYFPIILSKHELDTTTTLQLVQGPEHLRVSENSIIRFICEVETADPVRFSWTFNTKAVRPGWRLEKLSETQESLVAADITKEDVGTVGCFVSTNTQKLYQEGSIAILPDTAEGMTAPELSLGVAEQVRLVEGSSLSLECDSRGTPQPTVSWVRGTTQFPGATYLLQDVGLSVSGRYRCVGRNPAGTMERSVNIKVYSQSRAGTHVPESQQFLAERELRLECNYTVDESWGAEALVTWTKNGKPFQERNQNIESSVGKSVLTVGGLTDSDNGNYSCVITTPLDTASSSWVVEVVFPASITDLEPSKIVLLGTTTLLSCEATGVPPPLISWSHNGSRVEADPTIQLSTEGSLRLDRAQHTQAGEYRCRAENGFGVEERSLVLSVANPTSPNIENESGVVEKAAGDSFVLGCSGNIDPLLESTAVFSWTKDGKEVPPEWVQTTSEVWIPYLLSEHAGVYTCQIRTLLDMIRIETELRVETAEPRILAAQTSIGEILGGDVSIDCSATGIPAPTITFKYQEDEYSGKLVSRTFNKTVAVLDIFNINKDNEGEYVCLAVNEYGNSQASVSLDVHSRTIILTGPADIVLKSGESTIIPCKVDVDSGLRSTLNVSWLKNQLPVESATGSLANQYSLALKNLTKTDEGIYTCVAETKKDKTSISGRITVLSEAPTFSSTPRDIRILEGRDTELVCRANGIPQPTVFWTFQEQHLKSRSGVLSLSSLSGEKEGNYVCTAVNIYGSVSEVVNLQVIKGAKKENQNLVPDIVKNIKDTISLPCDFKVDQRVEEETRVIWSKELKDIPLSNPKYKVERNRSLLIRNIELEDGGQYTCKVITPLQEVQSKISLIVSGESPEILNSFDKVTIHEGETLALSCKARGVPRPTIEWLLKDRPVSGQYLSHSQTENSEFKETRIVIKEATKGQEGVYQCVAKNNVGTVVKNSHVRVLKRTKVSVSEEGRLDITVPAGQKLKLPCKVENDEMNRITRILWTKDGKNIQVGGEDIIDFGMDGSITIFNVQMRHEGLYRCTVTTVKDEESAEIPLKVLVNAPVITKHSKNQIIFSVTSISLECLGTGIPEPEIRWTFNRTITKVIGQTFDIKNAISADSGFYTCTAKNSIGETQRTISVSVVTLPLSQDTYQAKQGSTVKLPCVKETEAIKVLWLKENQPMEKLEPNMEIDQFGSMVFTNLSLANEGKYKCRVAIETGRVERPMELKLMPNIVTADNTMLEVKEGDNFTLKCDVLPGVNAKRMWKKDGQLVFPESGSGLDILQQGGVLTVQQARASHSGEWECIASTAWGQDTIIYWLSVPSRVRSKKPCTVRVPPVINEIVSTSNTSVVLDWEVVNFNSSCFQEFMIFWWSKESDSTHDNQTIELKHRKATINGLKPEVAYYFQVNLVRDRSLKDYMYGQTKSHVMQYIETRELTSDTYPKAVIIIVILVIVILLSLLALLYLKKDRVSQYLAERSKSNKQHEFTEFSSKLVANPDFMASLAPQWPEPEPQPAESHAFIQQQRPMSRRNSKTSITSSWSSLFNVVSNENLSNPEVEHRQYRGRRRQNNQP